MKLSNRKGIPLRPVPFVKWAGGKSQLLEQLLTLTPSAFLDYHEPFVGGGALFLAMWNLGRVRRANLNDLNKELMTTYEVIKTQPKQFCQALAELAANFTAADSQSDFYYGLRSAEPSSSIETAARFTFLNKTGYNGLYRVNRRGQFNVPFGRYAKPSIYDERNIEAVSVALKDTVIMCEPFDIATSKVRAGDFVYFDPPYQPISRTANFTGYTSGGFSLLDQEHLAKEFRRLAELGAFVMLSNSDHETIERLYKGSGYNVREVKASRRINSDASKRGLISELVVRNYN